jgi:hypothetical protein
MGVFACQRESGCVGDCVAAQASSGGAADEESDVGGVAELLGCDRSGCHCGSDFGGGDHVGSGGFYGCASGEVDHYQVEASYCCAEDRLDGLGRDSDGVASIVGEKADSSYGGECVPECRTAQPAPAACQA